MYRADENDVTYTRNFYNFESESLNLLKSFEPVQDQHQSISASSLVDKSHLETNQAVGISTEW